jgi:hypothetical protein
MRGQMEVKKQSEFLKSDTIRARYASGGWFGESSYLFGDLVLFSKAKMSESDR